MEPELNYTQIIVRCPSHTAEDPPCEECLKERDRIAEEMFGEEGVG